MNTLSIIRRNVVATFSSSCSKKITQKYYVSLFHKVFFSTKNPTDPKIVKEEVPTTTTTTTTKPKDSNTLLSQSPLLKEQQEKHIDYMIAMTDEMESSMKNLEKVYEKKKDAMVNNCGVRWMDANDIEHLFDESKIQKEKLSNQITDLKEILTTVKYYAVDAPDGISDGDEEDLLYEVNQIVDHSKKRKPATTITETTTIKDDMMTKKEKKSDDSAFAVDSPDGESDGLKKELSDEVNHIIDIAAELEEKHKIKGKHVAWQDSIRNADTDDMEKRKKKTIFAVDSPDGESDGIKKELLDEVNHIIDVAAMVEDKDKIKIQHASQDAVRKEHARDPEHDW